MSAAAESSSEPRWCVLATVSECTFERPMHIGDVSRCDARVTYAAGAAVEVLVQVCSCFYNFARSCCESTVVHAACRSRGVDRVTLRPIWSCD